MLLVILPFITGQICRNYFSITVNPTLAKSGTNWMILIIMLIAFLNAFGQGIDLGLVDLVYIALFSLVLKLGLTFFVWNGTKIMKYRFSLAKTLALGLPIATVLFVENPNLALITLPIIAYHTIQLIIDGIMAGQMAQSN